MKRKVASIVFVLAAIAATLSAAPNALGKYANFPEKPITYIITASAGGGLDIGARILAPFLQEELGKKAIVTVTNVVGGANWIGWTQMFNAKPDGYTISNIHTPQVYSYLNKSLKNKSTLQSFNLLCNLVTDTCLIAVRADDKRFGNINDLQAFVNYIKANPKFEFLAALTSKGSADELVMLDLNEMAGIKNITGVNHSKGIAEAKAAFLGGHVDLYYGKVGDTLSMYKDGKAKVIAVMGYKRSRFMPNIPTAIEQGYRIVNGSSRGVVAQPAMDPELKQLLVSAIKRVQDNPAYIKAMDDAGYEIDYMEGKDYEDYMKEMEAIIIKYADLLGYN